MTERKGVVAVKQECDLRHEFRTITDGDKHACLIDTECMIIVCEQCGAPMKEEPDGHFTCVPCNWTTTFSITS